MIREEILNMPAGREMDRLIAEKVMGLSVYDGERKIVRYEGFHGQHKRTYTIPEIYVRVSGVANYSCDSYSTDIKYAWKVYEKLISDCKSNNGEPDFFMLNAYHAYPERGWHIAKIWAHHDGDIVEFELTASSAPLAICRAALLAVEAV